LSRRKSKSKPQSRTQEPSKPSKTKKVLNVGLAIAAIVLIGVAAHVAFNQPDGHMVATGPIATNLTAPVDPLQAVEALAPPVRRSAKTLDDLLAMSPEQLADVDIAEMNLLCATGLPGAEDLDIDHCLATLNRWAERVRFETERHLYRAADPKWADHYRHSEAYLRAEFLLQTLQEDLGVKYDMAAADNFDFDDSRVAFIHGMIPGPGQTVDETPGGTCTSMPVMYVAIGRRLGYPLKLVTTNAHIFVRWDGEDHPNPAWRERFNIEGAGYGFTSYDDDHYKTWPRKLTDQQVRANRYLVSLTPAEEFAEFLAARGHCGIDNGQIAFAARCYENAVRYDTTRPAFRAWFIDAARRSGYRPATPALARLFARSSRSAVTRRPNMDFMATPKPSQTPYTGHPNAMVSPGRPQPMTPNAGQRHAPQPGVAQPYQPPTYGQPQQP